MKNKFKNAFNGLGYALKDKSILLQCFLGLLAIIGGLIIKLDYYEWLSFIICIGLVISLEIVNTSIERVCNLFTDKYDEHVKIIKDMSSAFVLVAAIMSLIVCLLVIIRRI